MSRELPFKIAGIYDTETTTLQDGARSVAFPCLYICNDVRDIDISSYEVDTCDDIRYYRYAGDVLEWLGDLMQWGYSAASCPWCAPTTSCSICNRSCTIWRETTKSR